MSTLIGLVALIAIVAGGVWALQIGGPPAQLVTVLVTAGAAYAVARYQDRERYKREIESKLVSDKRLLYKYYLDLVQSFMAEGAKLNTAETSAKMQKFFYNAMLNASDDVVRAQNAFLRVVAADQENLIIPALGDVVLAMRRDAGLETSLTASDIMRPLISDLDTNLELFDEWEKHKANPAGGP